MMRTWSYLPAWARGWVGGCDGVSVGVVGGRPGRREGGWAKEGGQAGGWAKEGGQAGGWAKEGGQAGGWAG